MYILCHLEQCELCLKGKGMGMIITRYSCWFSCEFTEVCIICIYVDKNRLIRRLIEPDNM